MCSPWLYLLPPSLLLHSDHQFAPRWRRRRVCSQRRTPRGPLFVAPRRLFYLSDRRPRPLPPTLVLSQVISARLQITLPPVWGSDPSQGSPLNLILIITSVINRRGLGGDYSTRPVSFFPLSTRRCIRPRAVIPVSIRRKANAPPCSFKDLATLGRKKSELKKRGEKKATAVPMWMVSYLLWASLKPSSHSASLLWELVSTSSYWQLSFSIDFSHGSYLGQYF